MFWSLLLATLLFIIVFDYFYKKRRYDIFRKSGFKGLPVLPVVGNGFDLLKVKPETMFEFIDYNIAKFGKSFRVCLFHESFIFTVDPKDFEAVLSNHKVIKKNMLYEFLRPWLGDSLLLTSGPKWYARRKVITPTFHFKILEQFVEVFDQQSSLMVRLLAEKADSKTTLNIFPVVCLMALDVIAETAMGVKINAQENPDLEYPRAVKLVAEILPTRSIRLNRYFAWLFNLTAHKEYQTLLSSIKKMHALSRKVIEERRDILNKSGHNNAINVDEFGMKKRMAFLDVLLQSTIDGKPLSNADIQEEVDTFMFEGHDTTTSGISHALYLIARHPAVQQKLYAEIRQVLGDDKYKPITLQELQELKYLECVIKESLRLYPSVPMIGRYTTEDFEMNGRIVPKNTNLFLVFYQAQRDADYFAEPNTFRPERFESENEGFGNPYAYVPFSAGPRNCVGQKFAMLEMKSAISKMLRHFELLPLGPDVKPLMNIILRSDTGVNLGLNPRICEKSI